MDTTTLRNHPEGRTLASLFSDLWRETSTLLRDEAELARAEISEKVTRVETGVASVAIGAAVLFAGVLLLLASATIALARVLPPESAAWLAPLIVGVVVAAIGAIALASGRRELKAEKLKPAHTTRSLRRDADLAREHLK